MKKRVLSSIAGLALAAAVLTACGSSETGGSEKQTTKAVDTVSQTDVAVSENTQTQASTDMKSTDTDTSGATFTVGFDQDFPPMGFVGDNGEFTGFDLDLAAEAAKRMGKEVVYQPITWAAKDMELESGTIDCIWNGFTMTGREDKYTWTEPYMKNNQVFVVKNDSGIDTLADLAGKIVDVQTDSSAEAALKEKQELTDSFGQLITVDNYNAAFMDLESGAVDAIAMDDTVASYQIEKRSADFKVMEESISAEDYAIGFKKGNEALRDEVQAVLEEMAADGTMAKISEAWFKKDITSIGK